MIRRLMVLVLVLAGIGGVVDVARVNRAVARPEFTRLAAPTTPYLPTRELITATYYCPGIPAASKTDGGEIVITNPTEGPVTGQIEPFTDAGPIAVKNVSLAPRSSQTLPLDSQAASGYVGVIVEIAHTGVAVEQRTHTVAGTAIAACSPAASQDWYFADGVTGDGSTYDLVLTNPFPDDAVVDMTFVPANGPARQPNQLQAYVIPPKSVRVVSIDAVARNETQLSLLLHSRRGRFVAAKVQNFSTKARSGLSLALGAPSSAVEWLFADGDKGPGTSETYSVLNPTDTDVDVDVTVTDKTGALVTVRTTVPTKKTTLIDVNTQILAKDAPDGPHSVTVSVATLGNAAGVVVERALTKTVANALFTTVVVGAQFTSSSWWAPLGVPVATKEALAVTNTSGQAGTFSVNAVGPGGANPITGMQSIALAPGATTYVDLTADGAVGVPIVIKSDSIPLVVEQRYPRGAKPGRTGALAIPE
jgi:Family of unknown function (DUF5719)